ncbi:hypothetical protein NIES4102_38780 [Chondrocystis sp. NIES-4102]|nr:hypothetical protein NIES4102_38780 [Chondrocystis sp. NIES-4102]
MLFSRFAKAIKISTFAEISQKMHKLLLYSDRASLKNYGFEILT